MQQPQPHLEILSRNRVNRSTIIVAVIPVTLFSGVLIYALWSFLWLLAYGTLVLLSISFLYLVAIMVIEVRRRWLQSPFVYLEEHGVVDATTGRMYPLAIVAPVTVTEDRELSAVDKLIVHRSKVLTAYFDEGKGMHAIEKELGIPYNQVRDWCNAALALRAKQQQQ